MKPKEAPTKTRASIVSTQSVTAGAFFVAEMVAIADMVLTRIDSVASGDQGAAIFFIISTSCWRPLGDGARRFISL